MLPPTPTQCAAASAAILPRPLRAAQAAAAKAAATANDMMSRTQRRGMEAAIRTVHGAFLESGLCPDTNACAQRASRLVQTVSTRCAAHGHCTCVTDACVLRIRRVPSSTLGVVCLLKAFRDAGELTSPVLATRLVHAFCSNDGASESALASLERALAATEAEVGGECAEPVDDDAADGAADAAADDAAPTAGRVDDADGLESRIAGALHALATIGVVKLVVVERVVEWMESLAGTNWLHLFAAAPVDVLAIAIAKAAGRSSAALAQHTRKILRRTKIDDAAFQRIASSMPDL
jgi:hypothetical protein